MKDHLSQHQDFDVVIVGAGPHALAVLSALRTPTAKLSEQEHKLKGRGQQGKKRERLPSVCVVDPSGAWLNEWNERFAALGIDYLRSPSWAHPDVFSQVCSSRVNVDAHSDSHHLIVASPFAIFLLFFFALDLPGVPC